jgi:hypothetical protein
VPQNAETRRIEENRRDYDGAKLLVQAGYAPCAYETLLRSFVVLGEVHDPGRRRRRRSRSASTRSARRSPSFTGKG